MPEEHEAEDNDPEVEKARSAIHGGTPSTGHVSGSPAFSGSVIGTARIMEE